MVWSCSCPEPTCPAPSLCTARQGWACSALGQAGTQTGQCSGGLSKEGGVACASLPHIFMNLPPPQAWLYTSPEHSTSQSLWSDLFSWAVLHSHFFDFRSSQQFWEAAREVDADSQWEGTAQGHSFCSPRSQSVSREHTRSRHLLPGRKDMTNLDSILKSRDITLPT